MSTNKVTTELPLIGIGFRMKADVRKVFASHVAKKPYKVDLRREPENAYDPNAVAVFGVGGAFDEHHLGYVPRQVAEVIAEKLDSGEWAVHSAKLLRLHAQDDNKSGEIEAIFEDLR